MFFVKKPPAVCKKHINRKKYAELVGESYKKLPPRQFGVFKIWAILDTSRCFFQTTQKQFPLLFSSLKSNTRRTGIKVGWRLLAKHVWKSSFEDWSRGVNFKNHLVYEKFGQCWKKSLSFLYEKQRLFFRKTKFQSWRFAHQ